ncbi:MAG: lipocalin family protein [Acidobacteriia bacterium]|nr:lipocalin family protein [Terriglobia bacterium]
MRHVIRPAGLLCLIVGLAKAAPGTSANNPAPLRTVSHVDLTRYVGTWYEIASYPQRFQKGCTATAAVYTLRDDGMIEVVNRCNRDSLDGRETIARGRARIIDPQTNAKLKVSFFWPFWGDYWIIDLDPGYRYAVVGHPKRKYLWILSRTPEMDGTTYEEIVEQIRAASYDPEKLIKTRQSPRSGQPAARSLSN